MCDEVKNHFLQPISLYSKKNNSHNLKHLIKEADDNSHDLKYLIKEAGDNAVKHGFYNNLLESLKNKDEKAFNAYACQFLLGIVKECTEAMDALNTKDKKQGEFEFELADIVIRVFSLASVLNIPLEKYIPEKMIKNRDREYLHGKKF